MSGLNELDRPFVSVIIPVFDHAERLEDCLLALDSQTYPRDRFEVIIVDNGSDRSLEHLASRFAWARLVEEPQVGSYAARNRGLRVATGEYLAFTDADCVPVADWIDQGVSVITANPDCGIVGGRIEMTFENPGQPSVVELYDSLEFQQAVFLRRHTFAATANLFTSREVVEAVGPFDDTLKSSGDLEWGQRVRQDGYSLLYAEDVVVAHPARSSVKDLRERIVRIAGGRQDLARRRGTAGGALLTEWPADLLPLRKMRRGLADHRLAGIGRRLQFVALAGYAGVVKIVERLRVQFCGGSRRA